MSGATQAGPRTGRWSVVLVLLVPLVCAAVLGYGVFWAVSLRGRAEAGHRLAVLGQVPDVRLSAPAGGSEDTWTLQGRLWLVSFHGGADPAASAAAAVLLRTLGQSLRKAAEDVGLLTIVLAPGVEEVGSAGAPSARTYAAPVPWLVVDQALDAAGHQALWEAFQGAGRAGGPGTVSPRSVFLLDRRLRIRARHDTHGEGAVPTVLRDLRSLLREAP